jgi:hypothetical protein
LLSSIWSSLAVLAAMVEAQTTVVVVLVDTAPTLA